jgi:hypothetical protein
MDATRQPDIGTTRETAQGSASPKRRARWWLFAALATFLPAPFFMLVIGGLVPTLWIAVFTLRGAVVAIPKGTSEGVAMLGILLVHVVVLGGLLLLVALMITWLLFRLLPESKARAVVVVLIVVLFGASFFRIYRIPGHNSAPPANLVEVYREIFR